MNIDNCIFSDVTNECTQEEKSEHIIQNGLGGSLESSKIICAKCNEYFSEEIDTNLTDLFRPIIEIISPDLSGRLKKKKRFVETIGGNIPLRMTSGGVAELNKIKTKKNDKDEIVEIYAFDNSSHAEMQKLAQNITGDPNVSFKFENGVPLSVIEPDLEARYEFVINDVTIKAVLKDCLEFIQYMYVQQHVVSSNIAQHTSIVNIRDFIRGDKKLYAMRNIFLCDLKDVLEDVFPASQFCNRLMVMFSKNNNKLIFVGQFLGTMPFYFETYSCDLYHSSFTFIYQKALIGGNDVIDFQEKCLFDEGEIQWRRFSNRTMGSYSFASSKWFQAYRNKYAEAVYYETMHFDNIKKTIDIEYNWLKSNGDMLAIKNVISRVILQKYSQATNKNDIQDKIEMLWENGLNTTNENEMLNIYRSIFRKLVEVEKMGYPCTTHKL